MPSTKKAHAARSGFYLHPFCWHPFRSQSSSDASFVSSSPPKDSQTFQSDVNDHHNPARIWWPTWSQLGDVSLLPNTKHLNDLKNLKDQVWNTWCTTKPVSSSAHFLMIRGIFVCLYITPGVFFQKTTGGVGDIPPRLGWCQEWGFNNPPGHNSHP